MKQTLKIFFGKIIGNKRVRYYLYEELFKHFESDNIHWTIYDKYFLDTKKRVYEDRRHRYSPARTYDIYSVMKDGLPNDFSFEGINTMEFGCGIEMPVATSVLFYLNGASDTIALDIEELRDNDRTASALFDIFNDFRYRRDRWLHPNSSEQLYQERLNSINFEELLRGNWEKGIGEIPNRYFVNDIRKVELSIGKLDFISSRAVLEHVSREDFNATVKHLYNLQSFGGISFHEVDLRDHRHRKTGFHEWSFMTEKESTYQISNKLRASEIRKCFEDVGYDVIYWNPTKREISEEVMSSMTEEFKKFSNEDLQTTLISFTVRKALLV